MHERSQKTSQKSKDKILTSMVFDLLKGGHSQNQIAETLNTSKAVVSYHVKKLKVQGFIEETHRSSVKFYVTKPDSILKVKTSLTTGEASSKFPKPRLNNMIIHIPIVKDVELPDTTINEGLRNVPRQFKKLPVRGITITRIAGKNPTLVINVHPIEIKDPTYEFGVSFQACLMAIDYLHSIGMELDLSGIRHIGREMAFSDPVAEQEVKAGRFTRASLGRETDKILPTDPSKPAEGWIDASPGSGEIEYNDRQGAVDYILMPGRVAKLEKTTEEYYKMQKVYTENLKLHMAVMKKLNNLLSQKKLKEFL